MLVFPHNTVFVQILKSKRDKDGDIIIIYPKSAEKSFLKRLFAPAIRNVQLDKMGSKVWELCDGKTTLEEIINNISQQFTKEKDIETRVELFLNFLVRKDIVQSLVPKK